MLQRIVQWSRIRPFASAVARHSAPCIMRQRVLCFILTPSSSFEINTVLFLCIVSPLYCILPWEKVSLSLSLSPSLSLSLGCKPGRQFCCFIILSIMRKAARCMASSFSAMAAVSAHTPSDTNHRTPRSSKRGRKRNRKRWQRGQSRRGEEGEEKEEEWCVCVLRMRSLACACEGVRARLHLSAGAAGCTRTQPNRSHRAAPPKYNQRHRKK